MSDSNETIQEYHDTCEHVIREMLDVHRRVEKICPLAARELHVLPVAKQMIPRLAGYREPILIKSLTGPILVYAESDTL